MTDDMQRARELLAAVFNDEGREAFALGGADAPVVVTVQGALTAITAALRAAPEGLALVPVDLRTGAGYEVWEAGIRVRNMGGSVEEMWAAMLAARPQGVKDGP
ncbi:hypothetical protein [Stenotrophomonas pictorum]|nr:hypothetical protein [Stenotrophomonas pictorum]